MKELKLQFDFQNGPIWNDTYSVARGKFVTGITVVDEDITIQTLNDKAQELYSSLYKFDVNDKACSFDKEKFVMIKPQLYGLLQTIIYRLKQINDGSFLVRDEATGNLEQIDESIAKKC